MTKELSLDELLAIASKPTTETEKKEANLTPVHTFVQNNGIRAGKDFVPSHVIYSFYLLHTRGVKLEENTFFYYFKKLFKKKYRWNCSGYLLNSEIFDQSKIIKAKVLYEIRKARYGKLRKYYALKKWEEKTGHRKISRIRKKG